jgi:hypothetical protein
MWSGLRVTGGIVGLVVLLVRLRRRSSHQSWCSGPPRHPLCDRPSLTLVRHCRSEAWSEKKKICTPASITIWPLSRGSLLAVAGSGLVLLRALLS